MRDELCLTRTNLTLLLWLPEADVAYVFGCRTTWDATANVHHRTPVNKAIDCIEIFGLNDKAVLDIYTKLALLSDQFCSYNSVMHSQHTYNISHMIFRLLGRSCVRAHNHNTAYTVHRSTTQNPPSQISRVRFVLPNQSSGVIQINCIWFAHCRSSALRSCGHQPASF